MYVCTKNFYDNFNKFCNIDEAMIVSKLSLSILRSKELEEIRGLFVFFFTSPGDL